TGKPCRAAAMPNGRCKVHGGKSTGPRTPEGLERSKRARWKHGYYSREAKAERSRLRAAILTCAPRSVRLDLKAPSVPRPDRTTPDHLSHRHRCQWQGRRVGHGYQLLRLTLEAPDNSPVGSERGQNRDRAVDGGRQEVQPLWPSGRDYDPDRLSP